MGLSDREGHYPCQLSGGQQQRVAIARALALHPDILCFDEPTSALDPELTGEVLKVIRSLAEQRTTMIIVTHEMAFARDVADQVIFMDGGVIVEQGEAHQVIEHPPGGADAAVPLPVRRGLKNTGKRAELVLRSFLMPVFGGSAAAGPREISPSASSWLAARITPMVVL